MAVTTTVLEILEAAYAKSKRTAPTQIANQEIELRDTVGRALRGLYAAAARINPIAFASTQNMQPVVDSEYWSWPEDVEAFIRLEHGGNEVAVVPFDQQDIEPGMPAVYAMGPRFYPAGDDLDPGVDVITAWYSRRPAMPEGLSSTLPDDWREGFNELLALEVAIYLALKDERGAELGELKQQRDRWLALFVEHLQHAVPIERRAWGHTRTFAVNTLQPLLAGSQGG